MLYILLLIGFVMLIKGADIFVASSSDIAKRFGIPPIIIGMTIVAMGTSAPELSVSVQSALAGMNDMSIANVVGSNIFNLLAVLGVSALFNKLRISNYRDIFVLLGTSMLLLLSIIDGRLGAFNGIMLLAVFISFIYNMIKGAKCGKSEEKAERELPLILLIIYCVMSLLAIIFGGEIVVESASAIATQLGMSENLVGLTIVAVGTSLPELVTSVVATRKGEVDIAVGNVIGSNIFNILLILGTASVISPMIVTSVALLDIIIMTVLIGSFIVLTHKKCEINKRLGIVMIMAYVIYIVFTIIR